MATPAQHQTLAPTSPPSVVGSIPMLLPALAGTALPISALAPPPVVQHGEPPTAALN